MNTKPMAQAKNTDFQHIHAALERAARRATELAKQTNTTLVIQQDGKMVVLTVK